jgi:molecular chaperone GrpE
MSESKKIKINGDSKIPEGDDNHLPEQAPQDDQPCETPQAADAAEAETDYESELEAARQEAQRNYDRLLRVSAEFDNYKKRTARESAEFRKYATESLIKELLPVVDNLERAIQLSATQSQAIGSFVEGVEMTLREMQKVFARHQVAPIEAIGQPFDPCFHQAVMQLETSEHPANTVVQELQKGYTIHDRLLRPAMVAVSKSNSTTDEAESTE